jgi:hypothetical protein
VFTAVVDARTRRSTLDASRAAFAMATRTVVATRHKWQFTATRRLLLCLSLAANLVLYLSLAVVWRRTRGAPAYVSLAYDIPKKKIFFF